MHRIMAALGMAMSLVLLFPTAANAWSWNETGVILQLQTALGTGCPTNTVAVAPVEGGDAFTVTYSDFRVTGGDFKNCQLAIKVKVPNGKTFAVTAVDNRGYALLEPTASGRLQMTTYFSGNPWTVKVNRTVPGPLDGFWQENSLVQDRVWGPCNTERILNINNTIRVTGPATSSMAMASTDASVSTVFKLEWRNC